MPLTGKQKAAMLLLSLDAATAAELLKGVNHDVVKELAAEVAYLDASGFRSSQQSLEMVRKFHSSLQQKLEFKVKDFLKEMLKSSVGDERAVKIQTQIHDLLQERDPFISIRSADTQTLVSILGTAHPRAAAVVLSELTAKKSSEVLGLLDEGVRVSAVSRMTSSESTTAEAKARIAEMICNRLEAAAPGKWTVVSQRPEQSLRKVAVILRNLEKELRDGMLAAIKEKDEEAGKMVSQLMIVWEDISLIADWSLREGLRKIDAQKLALALIKADETITKKILSNISEGAAATVDEETSLMSSPKKEAIAEAKEEVVEVLRDMNEKGELIFIEE
jgi:flagellar motor switch protein FliG